MDTRSKKLDKLCAISEKILKWVDRQDQVPLLFSGTGTMWQNAPAPYLEIIFQAEGHHDQVRLGDEVFPLPNQHICITNVHFGNKSFPQAPIKGWCLFLDVSHSQEFDFLTEAPLFLTTHIRYRQRMIDAFKRLTTRGLRTQTISRVYPPSQEFLDTYRARIAPTPVRILIKNAITDILAYILEEATASAQADESLAPEAVQAAMDYIQINYENQDLSLADIARAAHLSPDHLGRIFKAHTGQSPMQFLKSTRVANSCNLLQTTSLQIGEISRLVGFDDQYYFSRVFRSTTGLSPRQYRQSK